jgi:hypothetical protein
MGMEEEYQDRARRSYEIRTPRPRAVRVCEVTAVGVPPEAPVEEVSLDRWVVVRNGALTTAGMPSALPATMDELFEDSAAAELGAREQIILSLARCPRRHEDREIRPILIEHLPVRDYREAALDDAAIEQARMSLAHGEDHEPWRYAAKTEGCGGVLLPHGDNFILFVFKAYKACVRLGEVIRTLGPDDLLIDPGAHDDTL